MPRLCVRAPSMHTKQQPIAEQQAILAVNATLHPANFAWLQPAWNQAHSMPSSGSSVVPWKSQLGSLSCTTSVVPWKSYRSMRVRSLHAHLQIVLISSVSSSSVYVSIRISGCLLSLIAIHNASRLSTLALKETLRDVNIPTS